MALRRLFLKHSDQLLSVNTRYSILQTPIRNASFGPQFIKPIFKHKDIDEIIENGELINYKDTPIKPPSSFETCSELYDPMKEKFINYIMEKGKKQHARELFLGAIKFIKIHQVSKYNKATPEEKQNIELNPDVVFTKAIENAKPMLKLRGIKRAAITYQVPIPISDKEATFRAMLWYVEIAQTKPKETSYSESLALLLIDGSQNKDWKTNDDDEPLDYKKIVYTHLFVCKIRNISRTGKVIKRKTDLHRTCEANRAYAHYYFG